MSPGPHGVLARSILGLTPFECPDSALCIALSRAGALGVLDLGRDPRAARAALAAVAAQVPGEFAVRIPEGSSVVEPQSLPESTALIVVPDAASVSRWNSARPVLAQVVSVEEAVAARAAGATGLIAKGSESGGRVGEETAYVLLQRLLQADLGLPIWVQGGVGLHSAAAAMVAGARGIVLDSQLALVRESATPESIKSVLASMDGSETTLLAGHRVFTRPDLLAAQLVAPTREEVIRRLGGRDLKSQLLPAGQDAAFAGSIARRFRTAGGVVRGLGRATERHLRQAQDFSPFAPESPWARSHGVRYPIVQGPMTRVSDRAAFAWAVAQGGGLPFLALSLLRGEEVRRLLAETQAQLNGRPFGVGILGFVPPDLRAEQLEVVEEFRPPVALIAGGRPDQALSLENKGIDTYLHVPSPALLDLFLGEGARRFVFEGRECGGHVGPRSSFVLWEQMVERLLAHPAPEELSIVFAGGIHDARSTAMVASLAAPLAAAGARLAVLMGTAYLFTEEAVSSGAITPAFQEAALHCDHTVLLETAPGHATRCTESEFVEDFRTERRTLEAAGKAPAEIWAELEKLNVGRLRIAAKGLKREGERLFNVDAEVQRKEGMFMIGQVAAARSSVVTIDELHRDVSLGSDQILKQLAVPPPPSPVAHSVDVAIVGMAGLFPGATDLKTFWANILGGVDSVQEVPKSRWNAALYYDPESTNGDKTPCKWGGFLPEISFDPLSFGVPPRSLPAVDPVQLLSLEVARRALADAGYLEREFDRERTSVIFGAEGGTDLSTAYGFRALYPQLLGPLPPQLAQHLPALSEDSFAGVLSNVIAGRIANRLDLGGVNYTVDAACASSLAAVDLAVKELVTGQSEMVLCGGADLHNGIADYLMFASVHALSKSGRCRTFDADADGIVLGEGVACLVLKRLADAERDGDRIYAVVRGVGGASDGRSLGLTAPRKEGQIRAVERAYRQAQVSPTEIGLVEAHGTGTVVGDRTELASLTEVFARGGAQPGQTALGSVKSQIGHTKCTAGLAGMIKASLALYHRILPPTIHVQKPNPAWDPAQSPFVLSSAPRPWLPPPSGGTRKAAVSAFGFGGTNFHAVLAEYPRAEPPAAGGVRFPAELFLFRGETPAQAGQRAGELLRRLDTPLGCTLTDLAFTLCGEGKGPVQLALVAQDLDDLRRKLARAQNLGVGDGVFAPRVTPGALAFMFPGQGSQRPGMMSELFVAFPSLQRLLELGRKWAGFILPPPGFDEAHRDAQASALTDTRVAQPALGVVELAGLELLSSLGVTPDLVGGHSYGELVALCAAGALSQADLLELSKARAQCILDAVGEEPGGMAAVSGPLAQIRTLCEGTSVSLVNENAPAQGVIAGPRADVDAAIERLSKAGLSAQKLQVACAFHSALLKGADAAFAGRLSELELHAPTLPVYANATAARYGETPSEVRALLARQLVSPVRFVDQVEAMYAAGARIFVEVGPGQVLTRLVGRILGERAHLAVSLTRDGRPGVTQLLETLAELAVHGVPVQVAPLFAGRQARRVDLQAAVAPPSPSNWLVDGHRARPSVGELPAGALRPNDEPLAIALAPPAVPAATDREGAVMTFLQGMQQIADAQRDVMLRFLGAEPGVPSQAAVRPRAATVTIDAAPARTLAPPAAAEPPAGATVAKLDVAQVLLALVSERTGYPPEMLKLDADLEAELSIDSIKRIEILGVLTQKLGLPRGGAAGAGGIPIEKLAAVKTLRGIADFIEQRMNPALAAVTAPEAPKALGPGAEPASNGKSQAGNGVAHAAPPLSFGRVDLVEAPPGARLAMAGRRYWLVPDAGGIGELLAGHLRGVGVEVLMQPSAPTGPIHGCVELSALIPGAQSLWTVFSNLRAAIALGATQLIATSALGGRGGRGRPLPADQELRGAGIAGMLKSLGRERADLKVAAVDLDLAEGVGELANNLATEIAHPDGAAEIAWQHGVRRVSRFTEGPAPHLHVPLSSDSVVLITGGARGIAAHLAVALARKSKCSIELVGRRALSADEPPELARCADLPALRKALIARGGFSGLAEVEAAAQATWADREAKRTLAAIAAVGGRATYHPLDMRSPDAVRDFLGSLHARHGRLNAVFHAAGVTEDRAFADKDPASFARVVDTKLTGALALVRHLKPDLQLLAFFGSISGVFGNRGQVDYAAANDALDRIAWGLEGRFAGPAVSLDFGPWAGAGMVTPELAREYERRGIPLIPLEAGVDALVDILFGGTNGVAAPPPAQLVFSAGSLEAFAPPPPAEQPLKRPEHVLAS